MIISIIFHEWVLTWLMSNVGGDALYVFILSKSISEYPNSRAICSPLLAATLAVGTEILKVLATPVLIITLSHSYSWRYLQSLRTDDIGVGGIKRKGIDLDKSTKPCKETEQTVCESHRICFLVGKAVERFSSPTQINSRRFGNTKKPSFRI